MLLVVTSTVAVLATRRDRVARSVTNGCSRYQGRSVAGTLSYRGSRAGPTRDQTTTHMTAPNLNWIANYIWGIADDVLRDVYVRGKYRGEVPKHWSVAATLSFFDRPSRLTLSSSVGAPIVVRRLPRKLVWEEALR